MSKLWAHVGIECWLQGTRDYPIVLGSGQDVILREIAFTFSGARVVTAPGNEAFVAQALCAIYSQAYQWGSQNASVGRAALPGENFSVDNSIAAVNLKVRGNQSAHVPLNMTLDPPVALPGGQININIVNQTAGSSADAESIDVEVHGTFFFENAP